MARKLSTAEVGALGLDAAPVDTRPGTGRRLSDVEAQTLGLEAPTVSQTESALRGAASGASLGFFDELSAAASAALPEGMRMERDRAAVGAGETFMDRYRNAREFYRRSAEQAQQANPKTYLAGELGGAMLAPGPKGLGGAMAQGAAAGLGSSKADLTKGEVGGALLDTGLGAGLGAAGHGIAKGLGKVVEKGATKLREFAGDRALSAAGLMKGARKALAERYGGADAAREQAAKVLLDEGVVTPFARFGDVAERLGAISDDAGRQIGDAANKINSFPARAIQHTPEEIAQKLEREIVAPAAKNAGTAPLARAGRAIADDFRGVPGASEPLDFLALRAQKAALEGPARFDAATPAPSREAARAAYKMLREMEDQYAQGVAGAVGDPALAQALRDQRVRYGMAEQLGEAARDRVAGWGQNRVFGLGELIPAVGGFVGSSATGDDPLTAGLKGAAMGTGARALRLYGPSLAATGANAASKGLKRLANSKGGRAIGEAIRRALGLPATQRTVQDLIRE